MIKLVAFDLDGTIGDTIPMCLKALKKAVTPYVTFLLCNSYRIPYSLLFLVYNSTCAAIMSQNFCPFSPSPLK